MKSYEAVKTNKKKEKKRKITTERKTRKSTGNL